MMNKAVVSAPGVVKGFEAEKLPIRVPLLMPTV